MRKNDLTPVKAIRLKCLDCSRHQVHEVRNCEMDTCPLYEYRLGKRPKNLQKLTPLKAIREKCLDCSSGSFKEIRLCSIPECPLFPYRSGHNPKRSGTGNRKAKFQRRNELSKGFSKENFRADKSVEEKTKTENVEMSSMKNRNCKFFKIETALCLA